MKHLLFALLFANLLIYSKSHAQNLQEQLTNAKVIAMVKGGLPEAAIIKSIEGKQTNFDTSTEGLLTLKKQGVPDDVITAMVSKPADGVTAAKPLAKIPKLDLVNQVYSYQKAMNTAKPLEKASAVMKTKTKMLGYGGASVVYLIDGEKSPVRIDTGSSFVINASGISPSDFALYKLTNEKKKRQATTQKINSGFKGFGGSAMDGGATIPFDVVQLKEGVYQLSPVKPLEQGEYFFVSKAVASGGAVDVFAFGID